VDRATGSGAEQDVASPSSSPLPLSDLHLGAVKEVVREMLGARNWTGSSTVAALQARMSMAGHNLADNLLIKVGPLPFPPPVPPAPAQNSRIYPDGSDRQLLQVSF
jgi:hypothetical protein